MFLMLKVLNLNKPINYYFYGKKDSKKYITYELKHNNNFKLYIKKFYYF